MIIVRQVIGRRLIAEGDERLSLPAAAAPLGERRSKGGIILPSSAAPPAPIAPIRRLRSKAAATPRCLGVSARVLG